MKKLLFSPLTRIKRTGKISVLSYSGWRKFYKMNFSEFEISLQQFPHDEYVYNRKGEQLFFYSYKPSEIKQRINGDNTILNWFSVYNNSVYFGCRGLDCDGVPTFSHHNADRVAQNSFKWMAMYEPLTVKTVLMWLDWLMANKVERGTFANH